MPSAFPTSAANSKPQAKAGTVAARALPEPAPIDPVREEALTRLRILFGMPAPAATLALLDDQLDIADHCGDPSSLERDRQYDDATAALRSGAIDDSLREEVEDNYVRDLHDQSTPQALQRARALAAALSCHLKVSIGVGSVPKDVTDAMMTLSTSMAVRIEQPDMLPNLPRVCRRWGRLRFLEKLLVSGPPAHLAETVFGVNTMPAWAAYLCLGRTPAEVLTTDDMPRPPLAEHDAVDQAEPAPVPDASARIALMTDVQRLDFARAEHAFFNVALSPITRTTPTFVQLWATHVAPHDEASVNAGGAAMLPTATSGTPHFRLLARTLHGDAKLPHMSSLLLPADSVKAGPGVDGSLSVRRRLWSDRGSPTRWSHRSRYGAQACEVLARHPNILARPLANHPLDAGLFLIAERGSAEDWSASVLPLMRMYRDSGHLDVNQTLSTFWTGSVSTASLDDANLHRCLPGHHPLFAAMLLDSPEGAMALIELSCSTDPRVVFRDDAAKRWPALPFSSLPNLPGGRRRNARLPDDLAGLSVIDTATWTGSPRVAAAIAAAMMNKAAAEAAPQLSAPVQSTESTGSTESPVKPSAKSARRRLRV